MGAEMESYIFLHVWEETQNVSNRNSRGFLFVCLFQRKKEKKTPSENVTSAIKRLIPNVKLIFLVCD